MRLFRTSPVTLGLDPRAGGAAAHSSETARSRAARRPALGSSPRVTALGLMAALSLAACNAEPAKAPDTPAEKVSAVNPASDAEASVPAVLSAADLRRVCRAGLAAIHGQDVSAIEVTGLEGQVVNASWRAPVDGGRRRAQCRVDGDLVTWKQVDSPTPTENRWMNQSGDPVTRFVLDGDAITINTTLPDGATASQAFTLPAASSSRGD